MLFHYFVPNVVERQGHEFYLGHEPRDHWRRTREFLGSVNDFGSSFIPFKNI